MELTEAVFQRIAATDDKVHAYLTLAATPLWNRPSAADESLKRSADSVAAVGNSDRAQGQFSHPRLAHHLRVENSRQLHAALRCHDRDQTALAGAVIIGKTNLDEFAMGSSAENSAFFPTRNPWNLERIPGGSSGGSAAAVAADQCIAALGTDTGGSIRQPAACCGIVGLKPTYGRVSRYGIIAFASSMDQVGPMTKDVRDSALLLEAIAGHDPADSTSQTRPCRIIQQRLTGDVKGLRLGIPKEYFIAGMQPEVEQAVRDAIGKLEKNGAIDRRDFAAPHRICRRGLLHRRHRRGELQSGALRRHALRPPRRRQGLHRNLHDQPRRRLRRRGQAPHHARHLRACRRDITTLIISRPSECAR